MIMKKTMAEKEVVTTKVVQVPTYTIEFTEEQAAILMYLFGKMRSQFYCSPDGKSIYHWLNMNLPCEVLDLVSCHSHKYWENPNLSLIEGVYCLSDDLKELSKQNV